MSIKSVNLKKVANEKSINRKKKYNKLFGLV